MSAAMEPRASSTATTHKLVNIANTGSLEVGIAAVSRTEQELGEWVREKETIDCPMPQMAQQWLALNGLTAVGCGVAKQVQVKAVPEEVARLVSWVDTDGDGEIDVVEFEAAIRRFRRLTNAKAVAKEREGRDIMLKLAAKMGEQRLTARQFFDEMDESGDGLVAGYELRRGLVGKQLVGKLEATQVCHYMDPNADDAIEFHELQLALNRASQPDRSAEAEAQVGTVFRQLEKEMTRKQLRIIDLLKQLDADGDGSISASELEQGLANNLKSVLKPSLSTQASSPLQHARMAF